MRIIAPQALALPHPECHDRRHGIAKAVMPYGLGQHRRSWDHLVDARDGVAVSVSGDEDNRHVACLSKSPSGLDPFAVPFEINVHQDNMGSIGHCMHEGFLTICRQVASVKAQGVHVCF
jgi:hypothetical protein